MFAHLLAKRSWLAALVAATLVAGGALADDDGHGGGGGGGSRGGGGGGHHGGGGGGGGGGGRSFSGGGGGGGSSSMRSFRGGGGGGGGSSMKSWSGGSQSGSTMRSLRSSGGGSGNSAWSGGGGGSGGASRARNFSNPAWSGGGAGGGGGGGNNNSANQFRNFSGRSFSGGNNPAGQSGQSGDAMRQYRAFHAQSGDGHNQNFSGGNSARQRTGNDQLQQMFKQYKEQQAAAGTGGNTFDRSRGRNGTNNNNQGGAQTTFNQLPGTNNGGSNSGRGRGNWNRADGDGDGGNKPAGDNRQIGDNNYLNRFRNSGGGGGGNVEGKKWSGGVNTGGNGNHGPGQFGQWSKKDGGEFNAKTARWFGQSGFGDHRGRSEHHDGDHDQQFANAVRANWQNNWSNKHFNHEHDGHDGHGHNGHWDNAHVPFCFDWWSDHDHSPYHNQWHGRRWHDQPFYWWSSCSAPLLTTWVDFGWNHPCYWDYGQGEYITYYNNTVYVDNQRYATALDYYAQVRNLARSVPALSQNQLAAIEWLPLGVFAVTRPGQNQATELLQLAVSKDGILSGTLLDQRTGQARPLQGMVEQATQKAAWCFADSPTDALVVETSLYNLTEPECTALAHLDAVNTEVWQLVRLEQPQQPAGAQAPAAAPAGQVGAPAPQPVLPPQGEVK
jgi:hypothetical protein